MKTAKSHFNQLSNLLTTNSKRQGKMSFHNTWTQWVVTGAILGLSLAACSSSKDDNPTPTNGSGGTEQNVGGNSAGKGGSGGKGGSAGKTGTGGAPSDKAGSGGVVGVGGNAAVGGAGGTATGSAGNGETGGAGGTPGTDCVDSTANCYKTSCEPAKNEDFLNRCSSLTCNPVNNTGLRNSSGELPKIQ
jgi:hypothetical protein